MAKKGIKSLILVFSMLIFIWNNSPQMLFAFRNILFKIIQIPKLNHTDLIHMFCPPKDRLKGFCTQTQVNDKLQLFRCLFLAVKLFLVTWYEIVRTNSKCSILRAKKGLDDIVECLSCIQDLNFPKSATQSYFSSVKKLQS